MRKPTIVLLSGNSLCHNPRVIKAATTLARGGGDVYVLGAWTDAAHKARDQRLMDLVPFRYIPVLDLTSSGLGDQLSRFARRCTRKVAHLAHSLRGRESSLQLGFVHELLRKRALQIDADLYIAHSESGLLAASALSRHGRRVGVDMEDWFSEDLLPEARRHRPITLLAAIERELLSNGAYASCPSQAMSAALGEAYGCRTPTVIYNAFEWSERRAIDGAFKERRDRTVASIHWYSATLGPGRGLEDLAAAIPLLDQEVEIHLRGRPAAGYDELLKARIPARYRQKVFFHGLVANDELLSRVGEHDIGFAGEMKYCRSRDLTVTNKILHYLLGGLAVVASDTAGQKEIAEQAPDAVRLYPSGNAQRLADAINGLLASPDRLRGAQQAALRAAQEALCWERQEPKLASAVDAALVLEPGAPSASSATV